MWNFKTCGTLCFFSKKIKEFKVGFEEDTNVGDFF
jgi:hypothetical protein